jgi:hypothetical protein
MRFEPPFNGFIQRDIDVVPADVPLLFGLDLLGQEGMYVENTINQLVNRLQQWQLPLTRKLGHIYLE